MNKLRTYRQFKTSFQKEQYLTLNLKKYERSLLCQLRFGILPLRIETGRFVGEPLEQRLCQFCDTNEVESETHFLLSCDKYLTLRNVAFHDIINHPENSHMDLFRLLMQSHTRKLAKYIVKAYLLRRSLLYR